MCYLLFLFVFRDSLVILYPINIAFLLLSIDFVAFFCSSLHFLFLLWSLNKRPGACLLYVFIFFVCCSYALQRPTLTKLILRKFTCVFVCLFLLFPLDLDWKFTTLWQSFFFSFFCFCSFSLTENIENQNYDLDLHMCDKKSTCRLKTKKIEINQSNFKYFFTFYYYKSIFFLRHYSLRRIHSFHSWFFSFFNDLTPCWQMEIFVPTQIECNWMKIKKVKFCFQP